ncbi:MAG: hypothetical protein ACE3JK_11515 [Sporolactobacillus sp.]
MAFNGLKYNLAMLISSLTISVSAYLPKLDTALLITGIGLTGTLIYVLLLPHLDRRIGRTKIEATAEADS